VSFEFGGRDVSVGQLDEGAVPMAAQPDLDRRATGRQLLVAGHTPGEDDPAGSA